ncbi:hypothetical protein [Agromyces archimandritae]|uniref:Alternate-type signal peptide domain-containing protein n=1 Tax=Agromyces archimandritae TaxID=2781962 RepID=A0A975IMM4_9MICO|nr:hypothetical protein [Agromyces archimandritae]QTX03319.1 hypothetical protein G127AT_07945 [Agromyces archimandritae]
MHSIQTRKPAGKKRLIIAGGAVLAAGALATAAAFTDIANLNLGGGTEDSGIGGNNRFNIQVVGTDTAGDPVPGTWQEADTAEGVDIRVPGADVLYPGAAPVTVDIPFKNDSPVLSAAIDLDIVSSTPAGVTRSAEEQAADALIAAGLRYTVAVDNDVLASGVPYSDIDDLDLGTYEAGSGGELTLTIELPGQGSPAADNALQGGIFWAQAHFDAASVTP